MFHSFSGKGKFGLVFLAQHKPTSKFVAIKFISKQAIFDSQKLEKFQQEITVLQTVRHPFLMECFGGFDVSILLSGKAIIYCHSPKSFSDYRRQLALQLFVNLPMAENCSIDLRRKSNLQSRSLNFISARLPRLCITYTTRCS